MLGAEDPVDAVVRRHDGHDVALLDGCLEGPQVDFVEHVVIDLCTDEEATPLLVVRNKVLHAGPHPLDTLDPLDVRHSELGHEVGILAHHLVVPARDGHAREVDRGAKQHVGALRLGLLPEHRADLLHQVHVPAGPQRHTAGRHHTAGPRPAGPPHAKRPVGEADCGDADAGHAVVVPEVLPTHQANQLRRHQRLCGPARELRHIVVVIQDTISLGRVHRLGHSNLALERQSKPHQAIGRGGYGNRRLWLRLLAVGRWRRRPTVLRCLRGGRRHRLRIGAPRGGQRRASVRARQHGMRPVLVPLGRRGRAARLPSGARSARLGPGGGGVSGGRVPT
mmetsp:Transcript_53252/g.158778  ORF Transcript_53252/g.158778 Transcript_53252/m.158778 type:complete len:336 (-) Transcript_53252:295-1302(-)